MSVNLRKKKLGSGRTSLYLDVYHRGSRQYEFLNLYLAKDKPTNKETFQLAQSIAAKRQLEIQNSEYGFIPQFKKKANFVDYFARVCMSKPKSDTIWCSTLRLLNDYAGDSIQFSAISEKWVENFKAFLLTRVSHNSAQQYFQKIKAALNQAVRDKILMRSPAQYVQQVKMEETQKTFLTFGEMQKLASVTCRKPDLKRAFLFCCYTGLRYSDVKALTWANVKDDSIDFRQQKTKGVEYIPLSLPARKLLHSKTGAHVLPVETNKIFSLPHKSTTSDLLKQWCTDAGITKRVTFHTSRHTFATLALSQGVDLYTVSKLLGHKDISTTQIYANIIDQKKKDAVALLPDIDVGK